MSENSNQTSADQSSQSVLINTAAKQGANKVRTFSKIPFLLALLALSGVLFLGYEGVYGQFGVLKQARINQSLTTRLAALSTENESLKSRINELASAQDDLKANLKTYEPSEVNLTVYQLNALISSANQSLVLYHDYPAAIKLLNYAKQLLSAISNPLFDPIKASLVKDLDNIQAQNTFDNIMVAAQLDNLYQQTSHLNIVTSVRTQDNLDRNASVWQKFVSNLKSTLLGLVKIEKAGSTIKDVILPQNEEIIRQHLQIDLLNSRQALITRNQQLWSSSLSDAEQLIQNYFVQDQVAIGQLQVIKQLLVIRLDTNQANLDSTMQALVKLQQQTTGN